MIGNTLGQLVEMVRWEARQSSNTSRGTDNLENIKQLIKRHYQMLVDDFDWQHLKIRREDATKVLLPNSGVYDFPVKLNTDRISKAYVWWGDQWMPLDYGIDPEDLNNQDSDSGETSTHPLKWDFVSDSQFEVWPVPAGPGLKVMFLGQRKVLPVVSNDSIVELDDIMVSLYAASELLAANSQKDSDKKMAAANARRLRMQAGKASKKRITLSRGVISGGINKHRPRSIDFVS